MTSIFKRCQNRFVGSLLTLAVLHLGTAGCGSDDATQDDGEYVNNAEEVAQLVLGMAEAANNSGTFGVGGAIIENSTGRVVAKMSNRVLERLKPSVRITPAESYTHDPTAHGERQLVYWYYANKDALNLPETSELTLVTSLDPCAMCAGTLLASGFNVGVVAFDTFDGTNYNEKFDFPGEPKNLKEGLQATFGYYAIEGKRGYVGGPNVAFHSTSVSSHTRDECVAVFANNVDRVKKASSGSGVDPADMTDPALLPEDSPVKTALRAQFSGAFSLKLADFRSPDDVLKGILIELVSETPGAKNAVALIGPFGNLLMASADTFDVSPVATAFMNLTQGYAKTRFDLVDDPSSTAEARKTLTHPKYGTFVFLYALTPDEAVTLEQLGAYGSTMEGPIPQTTPSNFQYYDPPLEGTVAELLTEVAGLPPFYTQQVKISPEQVVP